MIKELYKVDFDTGFIEGKASEELIKKWFSRLPGTKYLEDSRHGYKCKIHLVEF